jgi:hypothetical protein
MESHDSNDSFLEVSVGSGNTDQPEVHLLIRSNDGDFAQSWFDLADLRAALADESEHRLQAIIADARSNAEAHLTVAKATGKTVQQIAWEDQLAILRGVDPDAPHVHEWRSAPDDSMWCRGCGAERPDIPAEIFEALGDVYDVDGVYIWWGSRNRMLNDRSPRDVASTGPEGAQAVMDLANQLAEPHDPKWRP